MQPGYGAVEIMGKRPHLSMVDTTEEELAVIREAADAANEAKSAFLEGAPLLPIVAAPDHIKQGHGNMKPCAATPLEASALHFSLSGYSANRKSSSTPSVKAKFPTHKLGVRLELNIPWGWGQIF